MPSSSRLGSRGNGEDVSGGSSGPFASGGVARRPGASARARRAQHRCHHYFTDTRKLSFACNWASHLTSIGVGGLIVQSGLKLSGSRGSSSAEEGSNMAWRCADAPAHAPTGGSSQPTCRHGHDSRGAHSTCSGGAGEIFWFEVAATQVWEGTKTEQISFAGITHDRKAS